MQARSVSAVSTRVAGLADLFRSPSKPGTNHSIPTNSSVAPIDFRLDRYTGILSTDIKLGIDTTLQCQKLSQEKLF